MGGLDYNQREVASVAEQVVHPLRGLADEALADRDDAPVGDGALLRDGVRLRVPPCRLQERHYEFSAGVGFRRHGPEASPCSRSVWGGLTSLSVTASERF